MKKFYLLLLAQFFINIAFSQYKMVPQQKNHVINGDELPLSKRARANHSQQKGGLIDQWVGFTDIIVNDIFGSDKFDAFGTLITPDSTMTLSSNGSTSFNDTHGFGQVFDPTSPFLSINDTQFATRDSFTIDSISFPLLYTKINPEIDTIIITISVADKTGAPPLENIIVSINPDAKNSDTTSCVPQSYSGSTSHGYHNGFSGGIDTIIKRALTVLDTGGVIYTVGVNLTTSPDQVITTFVEYKPGFTWSSGDLAFVFNGGTGTATISSFRTLLFFDKDATETIPAVRFFSDDNTDDITWNYSTSITKESRYGLFSGGQSFLNTILIPSFTRGYDFKYLIKGTSTVSIEEQEINTNFSVYPNPSTSGSFNIDFNKEIGHSTQLTVRNVVGQTIINKSITASSTIKEIISLSAYGKGIYFLTINNNTTKLVVE